MTQVQKQEMMIKDPIPGLILKLSIPTVISMLITSFYSLADTYFVGQVGTQATGAVGIVFPLMNLLQAFGFFFGHGSGNAISRKLGAGEEKEASEVASCGLFSSIFCGLLITVFGFILLRPLAVMLGATPTILPFALKYLRIILLGAPIMSASFVLNNQLRFQGNATFSMIGISSGAIVNVLLDPLLIIKLKLGVTGAAIATVGGQLVGMIVLFIGYNRANCVPIKFRFLKAMPAQIREIAAGGLPSLCRQGLMTVATITLNQMAGPFGDSAIAAMSVVARVVFFGTAVVIGCGQGFQPVCGYNYGAGNLKRVKEAFRFTVIITTVSMLVFSIIYFAFADELIALFRKDDSEVIRIGAFALRLQCLSLPLTGFITLNNMLFQTCKWTVPATVLAAARQGLFFIPAVILLTALFGLTGLQAAQAVSDALSFIMAFALYSKLIKLLS